MTGSMPASILDVDSADVNAYLQEITGEPFTAKDFRTWAGTVLACMALQDFEAFGSETEAKRNVVQAIESTRGRGPWPRFRQVVEIDELVP